jgi:glycoprotein endo-alpha-1,2-mannosidase
MEKRMNRILCCFSLSSVITGYFLFSAAAVYGNESAMENESAPVSGESAGVKVGVYYYPWYRGAGPDRPRSQWSRVLRRHLAVPQEPKCGLYDSADPAVIGEHISQSLRGGVDFWAVSWWGPDSPTDGVFRDSILTHPDAGKLKYAVLYESTGRLGGFDKPDYSQWIPDLKYIRDTYFKNPNYLTINGRPVVFFYLSREYFRNRGAEALEQMRKELPELYLVGDDVYFGIEPQQEYKSEWAKQFDAVTVYDVYGQSIGKYGATRKAVEFLAANYRQAKEAANRAGVGFMPTVTPGYNDTAVRKGHPGRARYFTDVEDSKEGDIFREMIRRAALPNLDASCGRIMMVTSFNEWFEDSQIEATAGTAAESSTDDSQEGKAYTSGSVYRDYGMLYLDILKEEIK